jgi:predicted anti-sigma-YlaC factor YlaD
MTDDLRLEDLLRAEDGDAGCIAGEDILDAYVELELAGSDPALVYPGTAIHLRSCPGCRADHEGLLEAARRFSDVEPPEVRR